MALRDSRASQDEVRRGERGKGMCSMFSGQVGSCICGKTVLGSPEGCLYNYVDVCLCCKNAPFLNSNFHFSSPGKTEAAVKNFSPFYSRQYSVAFCNHMRSEVEQQRDLTSQFLKTKVTRGHLVYLHVLLTEECFITHSTSEINNHSNGCF